MILFVVRNWFWSIYLSFHNPLTHFFLFLLFSPLSPSPHLHSLLTCSPQCDCHGRHCLCRKYSTIFAGETSYLRGHMPEDTCQLNPIHPPTLSHSLFKLPDTRSPSSVKDTLRGKLGSGTHRPDHAPRDQLSNYPIRTQPKRKHLADNSLTARSRRWLFLSTCAPLLPEFHLSWRQYERANPQFPIILSLLTVSILNKNA